MEYYLKKFSLLLCLMTLGGEIGCDSRALVDGDVGVLPGVPWADSAPRGQEGAPDAAVVSDVEPTPEGFCGDDHGCPDGFFCYIEQGCQVTGAKMGQCRDLNVDIDCMAIEDPVCGCDGQTYTSACHAYQAGMNVASAGACGKTCGQFFVYPVCQQDEVCDIKNCGGVGTCVSRPEACYQVYPGGEVCGCDGVTYDSDCLRLMAGEALAHEGPCDSLRVGITTDRTSYDEEDPIQITLSNEMNVSIFLPGCFSFSWQRLEDGLWVNHGRSVICVWEGIAVEVPAGQIQVEQNIAKKGGTWRVSTVVGLGCTPGQPFSAAGCVTQEEISSAPFSVEPSTETCMSLSQAYVAAFEDSRSCDTTINTPQCLQPTMTSLTCGCDTFVNSTGTLEPLQQEFHHQGCNMLPFDCPPFVCPQAQGSACIDNLCHDMSF